MLVCLLLLSVSLSALAAGMPAWVCGGSLRLRTEPNTTSKVVAVYRSGTQVTVHQQQGGWCYVTTPDSRFGYMDARWLTYANPTPEKPSRTWTDVNQSAWVISANGRGVRMRSATVVNDSNVLGLYPVGRTVLVLKESSDGWSWIKVDGVYGYMMSQFLTYESVATAPAVPVTPAAPNQPSQKGTVPSSTEPATSGAWEEVSRPGWVYSANGKSVNLRSAPVIQDGNVIRLCPSGTTAWVLCRNGDWSMITVGGKTGYMMTKYLKLGGTDSAEAGSSFPASDPSASDTSLLSAGFFYPVANDQ